MESQAEAERRLMQNMEAVLLPQVCVTTELTRESDYISWVMVTLSDL